jgi:ABC-2 type transport system permease protein
MLNLIKYELRGKMLTIVGICGTLIMGNLLLLTKMDSGGVAVPGLSTVLGIGALVIVFLSSLSMMSDYLYNEQGYLLFTLPQSGVSILASRLFSAVSQISLVTLVYLVMFWVIDQDGMLQAFLRQVPVQEIVYSILLYLWTIVSVLTLIYFCMVVGKIALKGKKVGKIGSFILFFALTIGINGVTGIIENFFPQVIQINSIITLYLNIGSLLFDMVVFGILFMVTSYLLEHKVDL